MIGTSYQEGWLGTSIAGVQSVQTRARYLTLQIMEVRVQTSDPSAEKGDFCAHIAPHSRIRLSAVANLSSVGAGGPGIRVPGVSVQPPSSMTTLSRRMVLPPPCASAKPRPTHQ